MREFERSRRWLALLPVGAGWDGETPEAWRPRCDNGLSQGSCHDLDTALLCCRVWWFPLAGPVRADATEASDQLLRPSVRISAWGYSAVPPTW